ncbi:unnamed protein product [Dracunculus medinensis]|uniref:Low-density lipoprotein receptor-related protein 2 n=1 Tax=Dracunculus medinensis TaxID=318479 RepID=A0A0N4UE92_DRAME|nr:unnamed protein product [Dracunculus medinensis]
MIYKREYELLNVLDGSMEKANFLVASDVHDNKSLINLENFEETTSDNHQINSKGIVVEQPKIQPYEAEFVEFSVNITDSYTQLKSMDEPDQFSVTETKMSQTTNVPSDTISISLLDEINSDFTGPSIIQPNVTTTTLSLLNHTENLSEKDIILSEYDAEDEESAGDNFFASIDSMRSESSTFNAKIPVSSKIFQTNSPINFIDQNNCPPPSVCKPNCGIYIDDNGCQTCQCIWLSTECTHNSDCNDSLKYCDIGRCQCKKDNDAIAENNSTVKTEANENESTTAFGTTFETYDANSNNRIGRNSVNQISSMEKISEEQSPFSTDLTYK